MQELEKLASEWMEAKIAERMANSQRILIEETILDIIRPNKEGRTTTALPNGFRIISTGKTTFKADLLALQEIVADWDTSLVPLKTKVELDETKLKELREYYPKLWLQIAGAIDSKPAKTHISVEV